MYGSKCKGVPKKAVLTEDTIDYKKYTFQRPNKFRESIRRNLAFDKWSEITKIIMKADDKRKWYGNNSKPLIFDMMSDKKAERILIKEIMSERRSQKEDRERVKRFMKETDVFDIDTTLYKNEQTEDALNEMKRYMDR
jgi:hypothetical protein